MEEGIESVSYKEYEIYQQTSIPTYYEGLYLEVTRFLGLSPPP